MCQPKKNPAALKTKRRLSNNEMQEEEEDDDDDDDAAAVATLLGQDDSRTHNVSQTHQPYPESLDVVPPWLPLA